MRQSDELIERGRRCCKESEELLDRLNFVERLGAEKEATSQLDYRVWYENGLWHWDIYGSATTPLAHGAALSVVNARAEAMVYVMRLLESDGPEGMFVAAS